MGFIGISLCLMMKKAYIGLQLCPWENIKSCTMDERAISFEILFFNLQFFIHYTIFNFSAFQPLCNVSFIVQPSTKF